MYVWFVRGAMRRIVEEELPSFSVEMRRASRISVQSPTPVPFHIDGDPGGRTPVDIEVTGSRFQLLVP